MELRNRQGGFMREQGGNMRKRELNQIAIVKEKSLTQYTQGNSLSPKLT